MKKTVTLLLLLGIVLAFFSCTPADNPKPEYEYVPEKLQYTGAEKRFTLMFDVENTEANGILYSFENTVPRDTRTSCIEQTEKILAKTGIRKNISVYVFPSEKYSDTYICNGKIYTHVQDWNTPEFAADIILGLFGEYCSYGLAYGYAEYLLGGELQKDSITAENINVLDINLLCFDDAFVSSGDVVSAKNISSAFVRYYLVTHGTSTLHGLLTDSGNPELCGNLTRELSVYYARSGIEYEPSPVLYAFGGYGCDYLAKCSCAGFIVEKNWYDMMYKVNPLTYDGFLHENYTDVRNFFEISASQMLQYRELFGFNEYNNDLTVCLTNTSAGSKTSYYAAGENTIYLMNADSLMHEYIHSITVPHGLDDSLWYTEGVARYFSYKYDFYGTAMLNADYNNPSSGRESLYVREYLEKIGRPIDIVSDFGELQNIAVYSRNYKDPNGSYVAGSSFVGYLVSKFGEQEVIDSLYSKSEIKKLQSPMLIKDWNAFIEDNYSDYSKY